MKKIDVLTFVEEYKNAEDKVNFLEKHIIIKYIPYEEKTASCERIVKTTSYDTIGEGENEKKFFRVNSRARYMFFMVELLRLYTDLNISFKDGLHLDTYNLLCKNGILKPLVSSIPSDELEEFNSLLVMTVNDMVDNERNMVSYLDSKFAGLGEFLGIGIEAIENFLTKLSEDKKFMDKVKDKLEKAIK